MARPARRASPDNAQAGLSLPKLPEGAEFGNLGNRKPACALSGLGGSPADPNGARPGSPLPGLRRSRPAALLRVGRRPPPSEPKAPHLAARPPRPGPERHPVPPGGGPTTVVVGPLLLSGSVLSLPPACDRLGRPGARAAIRLWHGRCGRTEATRPRARPAAASG